MRSFVRFLKYNNAIPIAVCLVLLGSASAFAATNPETIVKKEQKVISIDNTYIANKDLKKYTPSATVISVKEDSEKYYVAYEFDTISLKEHVWQDVMQEEVIEVTKRSLGTYRDLGEFVTEQLNEKIDSELKRLRETQVFEKKKISRKKVATKYSGIVGGFLSEKVETIAGYKPVVVPPKPPKKDNGNASGGNGSASPQVAGSSASAEDENEPPRLTILGENPAYVEVGEAYTDLGATVDDDSDRNLTISVFVNELAVETVMLNTSSAATYYIEYRTMDSAGEEDTAVRKVHVVEAEQEDGSGGGGSNGGSGGGGAVDDETETGSSTDDVVPPIQEDRSTTSDTTKSTTSPNIPPDQTKTPPENSDVGVDGNASEPTDDNPPEPLQEEPEAQEQVQQPETQDTPSSAGEVGA